MDFFFRSMIVLSRSERPILSGLLTEGCELHCEIILECHEDITLNEAKVDKFNFHPETHHNSVKAGFLMNDLLVAEITMEADETTKELWEERYLHEATDVLAGLAQGDDKHMNYNGYWDYKHVQGE